MKRVTNHRDVAQVLCQTGSEDTEVIVTLENLRRMMNSGVITIRDQFAMTAMNGLLSKRGQYDEDLCLDGKKQMTVDYVAEYAYTQADAMLKERNK